MNVMKVLAIAQATGGPDEVMKYYLTMAEILDDVEKNSSTLIEIANEFDAALDVIGHPIPITNLANSVVDTSKSLVSEPPVTKLPAAVELSPTTPVGTIAEESHNSQLSKLSETASVPCQVNESLNIYRCKIFLNPPSIKTLPIGKQQRLLITRLRVLSE